MCGQRKKAFDREAFSPSHTFTWFPLFGLVISVPGDATANAIATVSVHSSIR